jgi:hypothetical protein
VGVAFVRPGHQGVSPWASQITLNQLLMISYATMGGMLVVEDTKGVHTVLGLTVGHLLYHEDAMATISDYGIDQIISNMNILAVNPGENGSFGRLIEESFSYQARNRDWALIEFLENAELSEFYRQNSRGLSNESFVLGSCEGLVTLRQDLMSLGTARISSLPAMAILPDGDCFVTVYAITTTESYGM